MVCSDFSIREKCSKRRKKRISHVISAMSKEIKKKWEINVPVTFEDFPLFLVWTANDNHVSMLPSESFNWRHHGLFRAVDGWWGCWQMIDDLSISLILILLFLNLLNFFFNFFFFFLVIIFRVVRVVGAGVGITELLIYFLEFLLIFAGFADRFLVVLGGWGGLGRSWVHFVDFLDVFDGFGEGFVSFWRFGYGFGGFWWVLEGLGVPGRVIWWCLVVLGGVWRCWGCVVGLCCWRWWCGGWYQNIWFSMPWVAGNLKLTRDPGGFRGVRGVVRVLYLRPPFAARKLVPRPTPHFGGRDFGHEPPIPRGNWLRDPRGSN